MPHGLAGVVTVVHDQSEVVAHAALLCDAPHRLEEAAAEGRVVEIGEPGYVLPRNDEDVEWRPREDVVDGHDVVVLVDDGGGKLSGHDAAEQAVVHAAKRIATWA